MNAAQNQDHKPLNVRTSQETSFIVRIWWENSTAAAPILRGRIEHAASGEFVYFDNFSALEKFMRQWSGGLLETSEEAKMQDSKNSGDSGETLSTQGGG